MRILIVDASPVSAILVAAVLETSGHSVAVCADAASALQDVRQKGFDVIVLGAPDPDGDGCAAGLDEGRQALAERLREAARPVDADRGDGPCIVALRQHRGCAPANGREVGAGAIAAFIARPLDPGELLAAVAPAGAREIRGDQDSRAGDSRGENSRNEDLRDEDLAPADLDFEAFRDLVALGGTDFAQEILDQFLADGARLLGAIARAAAARDFATFREEAHALRSCAANVGARGVYGLCLEWREASAGDLGREGAQYVQALEREFMAASAHLRRRLAQLASGDGEEGAQGADDPAAARARAAG